MLWHTFPESRINHGEAHIAGHRCRHAERTMMTSLRRVLDLPKDRKSISLATCATTANMSLTVTANLSLPEDPLLRK